MDLKCIETAGQGLQLRNLQTDRGGFLGQTAITRVVTRPKRFKERWNKVHQHISFVTEHAEALSHCADTFATNGYACDLQMAIQ